MTPLFVANWKMNKGLAEAREFSSEFTALFKSTGQVDAGIAPVLSSFQTLKESLGELDGLMLGGQNVHWEVNGAHTGEISVGMLAELGAKFAIIGHSERREFYGETDEAVAKRTAAALAGGLTAIVCVGETQQQFEAKETEKVVRDQLKGSLAKVEVKDPSSLVIAYEPVWAIGTGLAATPEIAQNVHQLIREELAGIIGKDSAAKTRILYGGSTKPENIAELMEKPDVNGALVGGASLKAESFNSLIEAGRAADK